MRGRSSILLLLLGLTGAVALTGCGGGQKDDHAPIACREGAATFLDALRAAPGEVVLAGGGPISDCLVAGAEEGELADFGEASLDAAQQLNREARSGSDRKDAIELGFLIGAVTRGSEDTEGVHSTLLDRLTTAAKFAPAGEPLSAGFQAAYEKGLAAGRDHG